MNLFIERRFPIPKSSISATKNDSIESVKNKLTWNKYSVVLVEDEFDQLMGIVTQYEISNFCKNHPNANLKATPIIDCCNTTPILISEESLANHYIHKTDPFKNVRSSIYFLPVVKADGTAKSIVYKRNDNTLKSIYIDIVDSCNLRCPCCKRGTREIRNTANKMSLGVFEKVVEKAIGMGCTDIHFYNFSEPFLCTDLEDYFKIVRKYDRLARTRIATHISTNLSLPSPIHSLEKVLYSGCNVITVSVSGFNQETHEIYHKGSQIDVIKKNLEFISDCRKKQHFHTKIIVKYLDFGYNRHEIPLFKEYVENLGFHFGVAVGTGDPLPFKNMNLDYSKNDDFTSDEKIAGRYLRQYNRKPISIDGVCDMFASIGIDANADVYLCCISPYVNLFKIGNFLNDDFNELNIKRFLHPYCQICNFPKGNKPPATLTRSIINALLENE